MHKPINTAMRFVPQVRFVSITFTRAKTRGCGVVLNDEVVPVDDPDVTVRADFRHRRGGPFVITGQQVPTVAGDEIRATPLQYERRRQVPRWFADEGCAVPVFHRIIASGVECVARPSSESTVIIYLPNFIGNRV